MFTYRLYGLSVRANILIPGLRPLPTPPPGDSDLQIHVGSMPSSVTILPDDAGDLWWSSPWTEPDGTPQRVIRKIDGGKFYRILYHDGFRFAVDRQLSNMWVTWPSDLSEDDLSVYLLGPIMGTLLRLRGIVCLHASGVEIAGRCVAFFGAAEAGKSTTAAGFAHLGFRVLSDDVLPIIPQNDGFLAQPGYPNVRLCSDTVRKLYGREDALPLVVSSWDKRWLDIASDGRFSHDPLPLGAIYILGEREANAEPRFSDPAGQETLISLVANTYGNTLLDREMRIDEFALLSRLVREIPVRKVAAPNDITRLPDFCRALSEDAGARIDAAHAPAPNRPATASR